MLCSAQLCDSCQQTDPAYAHRPGIAGGRVVGVALDVVGPAAMGGTHSAAKAQGKRQRGGHGAAAGAELVPWKKREEPFHYVRMSYRQKVRGMHACKAHLPRAANNAGLCAPHRCACLKGKGALLASEAASHRSLSDQTLSLDGQKPDLYCRPARAKPVCVWLLAPVVTPPKATVTAHLDRNSRKALHTHTKWLHMACRSQAVKQLTCRRPYSTSSSLQGGTACTRVRAAAQQHGLLQRLRLCGARRDLGL